MKISREDLDFRTYRDFRKFCSKILRASIDPTRHFSDLLYHDYGRHLKLKFYFHTAVRDHIRQELCRNKILCNNRILIYTKIMILSKKSKRIRRFIDVYGGSPSQESIYEALKLNDCITDDLSIFLSSIIHAVLDRSLTEGGFRKWLFY